MNIINKQTMYFVITCKTIRFTHSNILALML